MNDEKQISEISIRKYLKKHELRFLFIYAIRNYRIEKSIKTIEKYYYKCYYQRAVLCAEHLNRR